MRRGIPLVALVLIIACGVTAQTGDDARETGGMLLALERVGKLQASQLKDLKTLDQILDEDFVYVDEHGALFNKHQILAYVGNATSLRYQTSEMRVTMHGRTAIVTGIYRLNGIVSGKVFVSNNRFVDTWMERDAKWVLIASLSTPLN